MRRGVLSAYRVRGIGYTAAAVVLFAVALSRNVPLGESVRRVVSWLGIGATGVLALCILLVVVGPMFLPARRPVAVTAPVRGRWLGMNSAASKVPSHGVRMYGQAYAVDLVYEPSEGGRPTFGDGPITRAPQEYPAFGQPVFAMIDGTVVRASDRHRDHRARSSRLALVGMMIEAAFREIGGPGFILGNHVTIRGVNGVHATVAHLQRGSVGVAVGDVVRAGQQLGCCGNTGNSSEPHVHAQLMDRAGPLVAQGIPMVFEDITLGDDPARVDALPRNGQHMRADRQPFIAPATLSTK